MENPVKEEVTSFDKGVLKPTETVVKNYTPTKEEIEKEKKEAANVEKK